MSPAATLYLEFWMSLISFGLLAWTSWVPALRGRAFAAAVAPILILHSFRHMGMMYLVPAVVPDVPAGFGEPTAYGDLAAAVLALLALGALRLNGGLGRAMVWIFNVVGFADLAYAAVNAEHYALVSHHMGVVYLLPAIVVPALLVTHALAFWLLLRRQPAAAAAAGPG